MKPSLNAKERLDSIRRIIEPRTSPFLILDPVSDYTLYPNSDLDERDEELVNLGDCLGFMTKVDNDIEREILNNIGHRFLVKVISSFRIHKEYFYVAGSGSRDNQGWISSYSLVGCYMDDCQPCPTQDIWPLDNFRDILEGDFLETREQYQLRMLISKPPQC